MMLLYAYRTLRSAEGAHRVKRGITQDVARVRAALHARRCQGVALRLTRLAFRTCGKLAEGLARGQKKRRPEFGA